MTSVLSVEDLSIKYNGQPAVERISFDVGEGDILGIVGPNGAGKTTLFRAILGLQIYTGKMRLFGFDGARYQTLLPLIGYVPQKVIFEPHFPATVYDVVSMGVMSSKKVSKGIKLIRERCCYCCNRMYEEIDSDDEKVTEALRTVGLESLRERRIGELSGGELQRVFIAQSLVKDPLLMILDEPVTNVDLESQARFDKVIKQINEKNGITIVWSSHDLDAISKYASRVACMNKRLFFHGEKKEFFSNESILKTYTESSMQMHMHEHMHEN